MVAGLFLLRAGFVLHTTPYQRVDGGRQRTRHDSLPFHGYVRPDDGCHANFWLGYFALPEADIPTLDLPFLHMQYSYFLGFIPDFYRR